MSRGGSRRAAGGLDEGAVQGDERPAGLPAGGQDVGQFGAWAARTSIPSCWYRHPVARGGVVHIMKTA